MNCESVDVDLTIKGLQLWIHKRSYPESKDFWDGNWLSVTAICCAHGAKVETTGTIIHLSQLKSWLENCENLNRTLKGEATLSHIEPNLEVSLKISRLGQIEMIVEITPDHLKQSHKFIFEYDQTYLPKLISQLKNIMNKYPLIGDK